MQLQCLLQVSESLFFALTNAGDINFEALRNIPLPFAPDGRGERLLHDHILSHRALVWRGANRALNRARASGYTETDMPQISRRILLSGAAGAPLLAQQAAPVAAPPPARDTVPKRRLLSGRSTAESLQKSLAERARWKPFPTACERDAWQALVAVARNTVLNEGERG